MDDFEFSESIIRLEKLIKKEKTGKAEMLYEGIKEKLDTSLDGEKFTKLESYWEKISNGRESKRRDDVANVSQNELFNLVIKEQRRQFEVTKDILWYIKFFFWLTIIGLVLLILISILL
jgi:hypothetical protein